MEKTRKITSLLAATALCMAMGPALAYAADTNTGISATDARDQAITWEEAVSNVGDTEYWLQLEESDMGQLSVDVPVRVVLAVNTDGTFVTPTAVKNVIENNSEFPVDVAAMSITPKSDFSLQAATGFGDLTDANIFNGAIQSVQLNAAGDAVESVNQTVAFTRLADYEANTAWAMQYSDGDYRTGDDCIFVQINGAIANVEGHYFTAPINVFDITYTFEASPAVDVATTGATSLAAPVDIAD